MQGDPQFGWKCLYLSLPTQSSSSRHLGMPRQWMWGQLPLHGLWHLMPSTSKVSMTRLWPENMAAKSESCCWKMTLARIVFSSQSLIWCCIMPCPNHHSDYYFYFISSSKFAQYRPTVPSDVSMEWFCNGLKPLAVKIAVLRAMRLGLKVAQVQNPAA